MRVRIRRKCGSVMAAGVGVGDIKMEGVGVLRPPEFPLSAFWVEAVF
jgi:hypothetical protein